MTTYRSTGQPPLCSSCGSASLTPPTAFDSDAAPPCVYFRDASVAPSYLRGDGTLAFAVDHARVCLDCGHVMLGFGKKGLDVLRQMAASLEPVSFRRYRR